MSTAQRVLAIVVTYNRLTCLKECIGALREQTHQDFDTLVVNNDSNDGTTEWLKSQSNIKAINQANLGGAGGFNTGMRYALEHGYDWIWMMDDDGIPEKHQLENLLEYAHRTGRIFLNALVVDKDNHSLFAFQPINNDNYKYISEVSNKEDIKAFICPFNGTFLNRIVMEKIGIVKKECFIWGDEQEYTKRALANGIIPYTVTNAIHFHPTEKGVSVKVFPGLSQKYIVIKPEKFSKYYYRNNGYMDRIYAHNSSVLHRFFIRYCVYFLRTGNTKELRKLWRYYRKGMKKDFSD